MKVYTAARYKELKEIPALARKIERLGFDVLSNGERENNAFLPPLLAAEHTTRLHVATNVAIAFARSPAVTAYAAWDLARFSEGRFHLGLGTQVKAHITRRFSMPWGQPAARLKEYIQLVRAFFDTWQNGTRLDFQGQFYKANLMIPYFSPGPMKHPKIPIHVSAVGPIMARMAGEVSDGIGWHGFHTPKYLREVVYKNFKAGAEAAGRNIKDLEFHGGAQIITGKTEADLQKGRAAIRKEVSFYGSTPAYHPVLAIHGWNDLGEKLHLMSREGKWEAMTKEISDEVVDTFATIATYDKLASALKQRYGDMATGMTLGLPMNTPEEEERVAQVVKQLKA